MTAPKSYDIWIQPQGDSERLPFAYGPRGGLKLGNALREPSAPSRVDTILIQSLHHGAGRVIATDPEMYRDTNNQQIGADARQLAQVAPGGALTLLATVAIADQANIEVLENYGVAFTEDDGDVVFAVGRQKIHIDIDDDTVTNTTELSGGQYFTGSVVEWNRDAWLGVEDTAGVTVGAYNYDDDTLNTNAIYMFSWAVSNRNAIFWIRNRSGAAPEMRWSDRTDQDFANFNTNFVYPNVDGNTDTGYILEIPKAKVTGMGVAGPYALFASKGGSIWGFDAQEVFVPLTPPNPGGFIDNRYGGPMSYVGSWMTVPNLDGLARFDPRSVGLTDISPAVHQGATPGIGTSETKRVYASSPSPTGAVVAGNLIDSGINILGLEMYEDGMFFHVFLKNVSQDISRIWALMVTRAKDADGNFTSSQRVYFVASEDDYTSWFVYRLDIATAAWAPGPETMAGTSGIRSGFYTTRPPDVFGSITQVRGYADASTENDIELWLEVDTDAEQYYLGRIVKEGSFLFTPPSNLPAGRKFAIAANLNVANQSGTVPKLQLPLSLDYRYVDKATDDDPDYLTITFECSSDGLSKLTGRRMTHGRTETEVVHGLSGQKVVMGFSDREDAVNFEIENVVSTLQYQEDGRTSTTYLVTVTGRRLQ